jgi:hypothetical protein
MGRPLTFSMISMSAIMEGLIIFASSKDLRSKAMRGAVI